MNTILTGDERPKLPPAKNYLGDDASWGYDASDMEAYADAREAAVLAKLREQEPEWMVDVQMELRSILCGRPIDAATHAQRALYWIDNAAPEAPAQEHYEKLEREHLGDPDKRTGIYAAPLPAVVPVKLPIPPARADALDVVYAEGWNAACDAFFGGKPAPEPLVVTVQAAPEVPAPAVVQVPQKDSYDDIWNALQRINSAAVLLPTFKVRHEGGIDAFTQNIVDAIMLAAAPEAPAKRCTNCDDTGDVHDQTGEWRGRCECPAGQELPAKHRFASAAPEAPALPAEVRELDALLNAFARACAFGDDHAGRVKAANAIKHLFGRVTLPAEVREAIKVAREALAEAKESVEAWGSYASEYFQKKHDLNGDLRKIDAALARLDALGGGE